MARRTAPLLLTLAAALCLLVGGLTPASADDLAVPSDASTEQVSDEPTEQPTEQPVTAAAAEASDTPTDEPTDEPSDEPGDGTGEDPDAFTVTDAVLRWGVNDESNNNAFAPGTFNFLSAGTAPDPGSGGQVITAQATWPATGATAWRATSGKVRIEKNTSTGPVLATFAGLRTGPDGQPLGGPAVEIFSNHQVVIAGGTGEVDPGAGTATIRWKGSFTVFYYSGMSFYTVTDPVLVVTPSGARITASGSGYASSMEDTTKWSPVPATPITLADLQGVGLEELGADEGFTAPTAYLGVRYDAPAGGIAQVRTGASWGAVPASMLAFLEKVGMAAYWYSSGGSGDRFKPTKPVTVSWDAGTAIEPEAPPLTPTTPTQQPQNPAGEAPPITQPRGPLLPTSTFQPPGPVLPTQPFDPAASVAAAAPASYQPPVAYALASSPTTPDRPRGANRGWEWALGFLLLLGAGGITLLNPLMNRLRGNR